GGFLLSGPHFRVRPFLLPARLAQSYPRGKPMFDIDLNELGVDLPEDKAAALKEALAAKGQEAINTAVSGLKAKNQELLGTIKTTKSELDQLKGQFDGLDMEAVKGLVQRASQDEETRLLAEGKIDEVFNR